MKIRLSSLQTIMYLNLLTIHDVTLLTMVICKIILFIFLPHKLHNLNPRLQFKFSLVLLTQLTPFFLNALVVIVLH